MRQILERPLWIGDAVEARDVRAVLNYGIVAVVDLAIEESPIQFPRDIGYCRFPLNDGAGNSPAILRAAIHTTAEFLRCEVPTLVACGAGMSRGPAVVAAAWTLLEDESLMDILERITADQPRDVSPSLLGEIVNALKLT